MAMEQQILVAGIGNIFLGDDGFGVEVAKRLASERLPKWVRVVDFGIRGIHLAYELLDNKYATAIIIDAAPRGGEPGTVYLIEPDLSLIDDQTPQDPHAMTPESVLGTVKSLGGFAGKVYVVGCEPTCTKEGICLSEPVFQAVEQALRLVRDLVSRNGEIDRQASFKSSA